MTKIQEAIAHFEYGITHDIYSEPVTSYVKMAIDALRTQQGAEKDDPLTLDELREMDGEPVWIRGSGIYSSFNGCYAFAYHNGEGFFLRSHYPFREEYYGRDWLAYRHKPEEGEKK